MLHINHEAKECHHVPRSNGMLILTLNVNFQQAFQDLGEPENKVQYTQVFAQGLVASGLDNGEM